MSDHDNPMSEPFDGINICNLSQLSGYHSQHNLLLSEASCGWNTSGLTVLINHLRHLLEVIAHNSRVRSPLLIYRVVQQQLGRFGIWLEGFDNDKISLQEILGEDEGLTDAVVYLLIRFIGCIISELGERKTSSTSLPQRKRSWSIRANVVQ